MKFDPSRHHRRSTRLPGFDYSSPGAYYVTVCVEGGVEALGVLSDDAVVHRRFCGRIAAAWWESLPHKYLHVALDEFVVMPDHFHGVLHLAGWDTHPKPRASLSAVMGYWKYETSAEATQVRCERWGNGPVSLWQRGFYDHIIRDEEDLIRIREYIRDNPRRAVERRRSRP